MNTQNISPWSTAIKYGLIIAMVNIIIGLIFWFMGMKLSQIPMWLGIVVFIVFVYTGMKTYRDELGGHISYGKALGVGVLIALIAAITSALYSLVFTTVIDPEIAQLAMNQQEEKLIARGMSDDQLDQAMAMTAKFMTPGAMALMNLIMGVFFGFIVSLITAIFVKKEPSTSL